MMETNTPTTTPPDLPRDDRYDALLDEVHRRCRLPSRRLAHPITVAVAVTLAECIPPYARGAISRRAPGPVATAFACARDVRTEPDPRAFAERVAARAGISFGAARDLVGGALSALWAWLGAARLRPHLPTAVIEAYVDDEARAEGLEVEADDDDDADLRPKPAEPRGGSARRTVRSLSASRPAGRRSIAANPDPRGARKLSSAGESGAGSTLAGGRPGHR